MTMVPKYILFGFGLCLFFPDMDFCNYIESAFLEAIQLDGEE